MSNENTMPLEETYLIRKNEFQGVVTMPREVKKKIILQDSQRQNQPSLLKLALINYTYKNNYKLCM